MGFKAITRAINKVGFELIKHKADIGFIGGVVLVGVGTVMVMRKAEEATEVKKEIEKQKQYITDVDESEIGWDAEDVTRKQAAFEVAKIATTGYLKTYGPAVAVEVVGLGLVGVSFKTIKDDLKKVSIELAATTAAMDRYRSNVRKKYGDQADYDMLVGEKETIIEEDENGKVVQKTILKEHDICPHSFLFDETNDNWHKEPVWNRDFVVGTLKTLNTILESKGYLFENDIRRAMGAPLTKSGQVSGILYKNPDGTTNHLGFGLYSKNSQMINFMAGNEPSALIQLQIEETGETISSNILVDIPFEAA